VRTTLVILVAIAAVAMALTACVPLASAQSAGERVVWECDDPAGDDHGPGSYTYPTNPSFAPYAGHFDIVRFRVTADERHVHFDTTLNRLVNTWNAPEGFSHQLIEILIDTEPGAGDVNVASRGANVRFDRRWAPDVFIRVLAWGGSSVTVGDRSLGISAVALPNTTTVRASVPIELVGAPAEDWRYYVLVSSQDGYGPEDHRPVTQRGGPWVFGGGSDSGMCPYVIDLLAPAASAAANPQYSQLKSWSDADRRLAVLVPANVFDARSDWAPIAGWIALGAAVVAGGAAYLARRRARRRKES
jgi:carbohydrate-binding DOMON domain-containing protein